MSGRAPARGYEIKDLVRELEHMSREAFRAQAVELLRAHPLAAPSVEPFVFFRPDRYTRNLVFKSDVFEVLTLCWEPGQQSSVHNHRDQSCWMAMALGALENQSYRVLDRDAARRTCRLEATARSTIDARSPLAVDDEEPVHRVSNRGAPGERAVSLHVYSKPFDSCEVYSLERGTYQDIQLCYWSELGRLCSRSAREQP